MSETLLAQGYDIIFKELDRVCKPGALIASNTSYLPISEMAKATSRPQDVVGMHFFSVCNRCKGPNLCLCSAIEGPACSRLSVRCGSLPT